jgi:hypothetical protein
MKLDASTVVRVLKRLRTAVGYHELGMCQHASQCLDSLMHLGNLGPFVLVIDVLRGEFVNNRENHVSAAKGLEIAACMLPRSIQHAISMTLATCYGRTSNTSRITASVDRTRGPEHERQPKPAC